MILENKGRNQGQRADENGALHPGQSRKPDSLHAGGYLCRKTSRRKFMGFFCKTALAVLTAVGLPSILKLPLSGLNRSPGKLKAFQRDKLYTKHNLAG